ncbi:hypothetical protein B0H19DRAFT_1375751 [Mycena capillaripes]|nr:hypothetical protein B0H19DRAFT_1375751 [Mycena capillaripes]
MGMRAALKTIASIAMQAGKSVLRSTCGAHQSLPRRRTSAKDHTTGTPIGSSMSATLLTRTHAHRRQVHSNATAASPQSTATQRDPEVLHALKQSHNAKGVPTEGGGAQGARRSARLDPGCTHREQDGDERTRYNVVGYRAPPAHQHRARIGTSIPWKRTRAHLDAAIVHGVMLSGATRQVLHDVRARICIGFGGIALVFRLWLDRSCAGHSPDADECDGAAGRGDGHKQQLLQVMYVQACERVTWGVRGYADDVAGKTRTKSRFRIRGRKAMALSAVHNICFPSTTYQDPKHLVLDEYGCAGVELTRARHPDEIKEGS